MRTAESAEVYNYFRDYDPAIGRYAESDPIGLDGMRSRLQEESNRASVLAGAKPNPDLLLPELRANLYDYVDGSPLNKIDVSGQWGFQAVAIAVGATAAAVVILAIRGCVLKCEDRCPYKKDANDVMVEIGRKKWINKCQWDCVKSFGELAKGGPW